MDFHQVASGRSITDADVIPIFAGHSKGRRFHAETRRGGELMMLRLRNDDLDTVAEHLKVARIEGQQLARVCFDCR